MALPPHGEGQVRHNPGGSELQCPALKLNPAPLQPPGGGEGKAIGTLAVCSRKASTTLFSMVLIQPHIKLKQQQQQFLIEGSKTERGGRGGGGHNLKK